LSWATPPARAEVVLGAANAQAARHLERWATWPVMASVLVGPRKSGRSRMGRAFVARTGGELADDAQAWDEERLFHAWNAAQERRRPLLMIADVAPPVWAPKLPDLRSRLAATPVAHIEEPDDALFGALVTQILAERGLVAPPELARFLLPRVERSYLSVQRVVDALDAHAFSRQARPTVPMARKALRAAGLLDDGRLPFAEAG